MCNEQTNQRTIRVMGDGKASVMPDTTVLKFDIETEHPDYANAYEVAAQGNAALRKALQELSIDPDKLKTTNFRIDKKYDSVREKGVYKQVFAGYKLIQSLRIELPIDGTLTSKVLIELGKAWPDLEVRISHIYADEDDLKLKVLESAMKDAKRKASVMAAALGYTLGDAILVDYSRCEIDIYHSERTMCCYETAPAYGSMSKLDVTPEDVESSDSVLTVWLLK